MAVHTRPTSRLLEFLIPPGSYYPVYQLLCSFLDINGIITLTRTSKQLSHLYRELLHTEWNINTRLSKFFPNPEEFRAVQGEADALIVGGLAQAFFWRDSQDEGTAVIAVRHGEGSETMRKYLVSAGYTASGVREGAVQNNNGNTYVKVCSNSQCYLLSAFLGLKLTFLPTYHVLRSLHIHRRGRSNNRGVRNTSVAPSSNTGLIPRDPRRVHNLLEQSVLPLPQ